MELVCYTQESHTIIPSRVHHSVEELSKVNHSWQKVCHFWHPFSIYIAPENDIPIFIVYSELFQIINK